MSTDQAITQLVPAYLIDQLQAAFDKAEQETADQFNSQTCSLTDKDGHDTCPICYFRQRVKKHLGITGAT